VARHRIVDLFRRQLAGEPERCGPVTPRNRGETLEDLLPSREGRNREAIYARRVLFEAIEQAVEELPAEQRAVFVAHEIEGRGFREMAEQTGVSINTLLSRKRYAVRPARASGCRACTTNGPLHDGSGHGRQIGQIETGEEADHVHAADPAGRRGVHPGGRGGGQAAVECLACRTSSAGRSIGFWQRARHFWPCAGSCSAGLGRPWLGAAPDGADGPASAGSA
jgi:hypothetical protein